MDRISTGCLQMDSDTNSGGLSNNPDSPDSSIDTDSVATLQDHALTQNVRDVLVAATLFKAEIICTRSIGYMCGYEIKPQVWFYRLSPETERITKLIGLNHQRIYSKTEDITKLLFLFKKYYSLSNTPQGIELVIRLNGILNQPKTYSEVSEALELIEGTLESL